MLGFLFDIKKSFKGGWTKTDTDGDKYSPFLYIGKVEKQDGSWAYVVIVGPYYLIGNRRQGKD